MDMSLYSHLAAEGRLRFAPIAATTAGATVVIPAVPEKRFTVLSYVCNASAATTIKFADVTGDLTGEFTIANAESGLDPSFSPIGHFRTRKGEALSIVLSEAVTVGGHLVYLEQ